MVKSHAKLATAVLAQALADLQLSEFSHDHLESRRLFFNRNYRRHLDVLLAMAGLEKHQIMDFVDRAYKTKRKQPKNWQTVLERSSVYD